MRNASFAPGQITIDNIRVKVNPKKSWAIYYSPELDMYYLDLSYERYTWRNFMYYYNGQALPMTPIKFYYICDL